MTKELKAKAILLGADRSMKGMGDVTTVEYVLYAHGRCTLESH